MACGKSFFFLFALLLAIQAFVLAEEGSNTSSNSQMNYEEQPAWYDSLHDDRNSLFSQFFGLGSDFNPFGQLLSSFSQLFPFPGLGSRNNSVNSSLGFPPFPFLSGSSRSQEIFASGLGDDETASPQDRFFFHALQSSGIPIGCNYTSQAGYSCAGCREQLLCNSNGVGRLRICPFYAPYCYNGVCGTFVNTTCTNSTG